MLSRTMRLVGSDYAIRAELPDGGRAHRYVASSIVGADGSAVAAWPDDWGVAGAAQATAGKRPTLQTAGDGTIGGRAAVSFDASLEQYLVTAVAREGSPFTIAAVVRGRDLAGEDRTILGGDSYLGVKLRVGANLRPGVGRSNGEHVIPGSDLVPAIVEDEPQIIVATLDDDGEYRLYVTALAPSMIGRSTYPPADAAMRLGGDVGGAAMSWTGEIAELDLWDRVLTEPELRSLFAYLSQRYGIPLVDRKETTIHVSRATTDTGQPLFIVKPRQYHGEESPLVIYCHGVGGDQQEIIDFARILALPEFTSAGFILVGTYAAGNNWGNQAGIDQFVDAYEYMTEHYTIGKVFSLGASMGGLVSVLAIPDGRVPIAAWIGASPVVNLAQIFTVFTAGVKIAYGIADDGSDYAAKTAGHDPMLIPVEDFRDVPLRFYTPADDQIVYKEPHSYALQARLDGSRPEADVLETIAGDGGHASVGPWRDEAEDMVAFFRRYL